MHNGDVNYIENVGQFAKPAQHPREYWSKENNHCDSAASFSSTSRVENDEYCYAGSGNSISAPTWTGGNEVMDI